MSYNTETDKAS